MPIALWKGNLRHNGSPFVPAPGVPRLDHLIIDPAAPPPPINLTIGSSDSYQILFLSIDQFGNGFDYIADGWTVAYAVTDFPLRASVSGSGLVTPGTQSGSATIRVTLSKSGSADVTLDFPGQIAASPSQTPDTVGFSPATFQLRAGEVQRVRVYGAAGSLLLPNQSIALTATNHPSFATATFVAISEPYHDYDITGVADSGGLISDVFDFTLTY